MKTKLHEYLRWIIAPILAACLVSLLAMPAYPKSTEPKVSSQSQVVKPQSGDSNGTLEIRKLIDELQARERENYTLVLEGERKNIDWWFSFLAIVTAIIAIFGALIPFLMARKDRELIKQDKKLMGKMLDEAKVTVTQIHQHETDAKQYAEAMKSYQSGQPVAEAKELKEAVAAVQKDTTSDYILKVRAEAIAASQTGQANKAYSLWCALTELAPNDASTYFNTAYWAQQLGEKSQADESMHWIKQAEQYYLQTLRIDPNLLAAINNFGAALDSEARAIAATDLNAARKLWQQSVEKYQQAIRAKPDYDIAVFNWGNSLSMEAQVIAATAPDAAHKLWQQAGEKYQQAISIKPDYHDAVINWGNALGSEAQTIVATDPDAARKLWQQAGEKYQQAISIKPDSSQAFSNWGSAVDLQARLIAATDTDAARKLWQQAGEKYQQAISIKPDYLDAAFNWGNALSLEAMAIAATDPDAARKLLQQAGEKYQQAISIKPDSPQAFCYWGNELDQEARLIAATDPDGARKLWQQSGEKFQQAIKIKPDFHDAVINWGNMLSVEAQAIAATDPDAARKLWQQSYEKYQEAISLKSDSHLALCNLGNALSQEAKAIAATNLDAALKLWQQGGEKFQQALNIKPDFHEAANLWGNALLNIATALTLTDSVQAQLLQNRAEGLLLQHADNAPGMVAYNLACVYGLQGNVSKCLNWLKTCQEYKTLPNCKHLKSDSDLDPVRTLPEFVEWLRGVCS